MRPLQLPRAAAAHKRPLHALAVSVLVACAPLAALAQQDSLARLPRGREFTILPSLNYDADEGFGYGAFAEVYDYGRGVRPYRYTVQPTVFLTTEGRRDVTVFFDAPRVAGAWRITAFAGREHQLAAPWYGAGNASTYDSALEEGANPYYYRYDRLRTRLTADVQHRIARLPMRALVGLGFVSHRVDPTPFDSGTTLLAQQLGTTVALRTHRSSYVRVGLVMDTRDREIGAQRGWWNEVLVERASRALGATSEFTRVSGTVRAYVPVATRLTLAERLVVQGISAGAPMEELPTIGSSFKPLDGLGGSSSLRGVPKDRYQGRSLALLNSELRWHVGDIAFPRRTVHVVLNGFVDAGRVWQGAWRDPSGSGWLDGLHVGVGGGARLGLGESFVLAGDVAHSREAAAQLYLGVGYLF